MGKTQIKINKKEQNQHEFLFSLQFYFLSFAFCPQDNDNI